jgi:hypothetical protein
MRNINSLSNIFPLIAGEEWGHRHIEKLIFVAVLQRWKKYEKHRSKEEEEEGKTASEKLTSWGRDDSFMV